MTRRKRQMSAAMTERNERICALYRSGQSLREIADQFGLSPQGVHRVLHYAGLTRKDRPVVLSDRDHFLGVNLSTDTKDALKAEADKRGVSMSRLTSDALDMILGTESK